MAESLYINWNSAFEIPPVFSFNICPYFFFQNYAHIFFPGVLICIIKAKLRVYYASCTRGFWKSRRILSSSPRKIVWLMPNINNVVTLLWFYSVSVWVARRGGAEVAGWTLDRMIRVRFPAYPHRVWALWWQGGKRRLRTCPCRGRLGTLKTPSCPWRGCPAAGQNLETGHLSRHYIAEISLNVTLNHNQQQQLSLCACACIAPNHMPLLPTNHLFSSLSSPPSFTLLYPLTPSFILHSTPSLSSPSYSLPLPPRPLPSSFPSPPPPFLSLPSSLLGRGKEWKEEGMRGGREEREWGREGREGRGRAYTLSIFDLISLLKGENSLFWVSFPTYIIF